MTKTFEIAPAGIRTPVLQAGPPDAREAVVFVHGNPGSGEEWRFLLEPAGEHARAVAFDMPGFGRGERRLDFGYTLADYVWHLDRCLEATRIDRVHLVAHDFGGPWALTWAAERPERLASVALVNTGLLLHYHRWHALARVWRMPVAGELFQAITTKAALRAVLRVANPRPMPEAWIDRLWAENDLNSRRAVLRLYRSVDHPDADAARIAPILRERASVEALVVWGARDPFISVDLAERQREVWPDADVHVLDDSGHWPHVDAPEAVAALVSPFLRRVTV